MYDHISPLLESLHWLLISKRIDYKLSSLCQSAITSAGPQYLDDLFNIYVPSRGLRSSSDNMIFRLLMFKTKHYKDPSLFKAPVP